MLLRGSERGVVAFLLSGIFIILLAGLAFFELPLLGPAFSDAAIHYDFENGYLNSGDIFHALPEGNVPLVEGGVEEGTALFDGTSYLRVNESETLDMTQDMTISFWMYPFEEPQGSTSWRIIGKGDTTNHEFDIRLQQADPNYLGNMYLVFSQSDQYDPIISFDSDVSFPLNMWSHVVVRLSEGEVAWFVNGIFIWSTTRTRAPDTTPLPLTIGNAPTEEGFEGLLDDIQVYTRPLSNTEINALYTQSRALLSERTISSLPCSDFGYEFGAVYCCDTSCTTYDLSLCYTTQSWCTDPDSTDPDHLISSSVESGYDQTYGPSCSQGQTESHLVWADAMDYCTDSVTVSEASCSSSSVSIFTNVTCPYSCVNGHCTNREKLILEMSFENYTAPGDPPHFLLDHLYEDSSGMDNYLLSASDIRTDAGNANHVALLSGTEILNRDELNGLLNSFNQVDDFALSFWLNPIRAFATPVRIFNLLNGSVELYLLEENNSFSLNYLITYYDGQQRNGTFGIIGNGWNFITLSTREDPLLIETYVNGVQTSTWAESNDPGIDTLSGRGFTAGAVGAAGVSALFDELRIYTRTLSGGELFAQYLDQQTIFSRSIALSLNAPANLAALGGSGNVALTWIDTSTGEEGFAIERFNDQNTIWELISLVGINSSSFNDLNIVEGTTYRYRVYAYHLIFGNSTYSNEASATPTGATNNNVGGNNGGGGGGGGGGVGRVQARNTTNQTLSTRNNPMDEEETIITTQEENTRSTEGTAPGSLVWIGWLSAFIIILGVIIFVIYRKKNHSRTTHVVHKRSSLERKRRIASAILGGIIVCSLVALFVLSVYDDRIFLSPATDISTHVARGWAVLIGAAFLTILLIIGFIWYIIRTT